MSALAKLTVKTVTRTNKQDPVQLRRQTQAVLEVRVRQRWQAVCAQ